MEKIDNVRISECENSLYIRPARMRYTQNGKEKIWDLMKVHDSVAIVIFNISRQVLVFVKQFRPAVYYNSLPAEETGPTIDTSKYPPSEGITIELCAGIVDKDKCLEEIAKDEILEECGYDVPISSIKKITSFKSGVGVSGSVQTLFYAEVTDGMRQHSGGGNTCEGEEIDVVDLTLSEAKALIFNEDVPRPVTLILALMWFFDGNMSLTNLPNKL
ncbi:uridine diphosphate glucose pyrophosphatase-like isoform X3 [Limulus polyphemus]|uniref:Uridine diphosphate glucose pyrophosphatase-like isoform X3 n=2 Tax=Limulus polyphemus TaxID=6850 RepID=A0ABM1BC12_LIMPO|nr:uridine diphosphate glucose pyrophosphatase-like isoform X3 [Limulus polyphemus]